MSAPSMRRLGWVVLALCGFLPGLSAEAQPFEGGRSRTSLNQDWRYAEGPQVGAALPDHEDASWKQVALPHTWNAGDAFDKRKPYRRGEGWYRRSLKLDQALHGKRLFLRFEGANQVAEVFVNGESVGAHVGGYTAFAFDITQHVRFDAANVIAVRVDNRHDEDIPPLNADFTFYGGIYRDVWLIATDSVHIDVLDHASSGLFVDTPKISERSAEVRVRGTVVNDSDQAKVVELTHRVLDAEDREVARMRSQVRVAAGGRVPFAQQSRAIRNPKLWSPEQPYLYRVTTEIADTQQVLDRVEARFGMRWFQFDAQRGFVLNGKPYALHGSNRHQDRAGYGNAMSDMQHREDLQHIKDTGFNFVRLAHYPQDPAVLEAADELGLAVWEEIPVVNLVTPTPRFAHHAERMLVEMVRQHYNHPSVVMWGYMNEVMQFRPKPEPEGYESDLLALAHRLEARTRQEDPFRATATAISFTEIDNGSGFQDIPQVLGLNIYFGWYYEDLDSLGPWLDALHAKHPRRPIFISEYGADSDDRVHARDPVAFDFSAEYQQTFHERSFAQMAARPWLAGTAVWNHFDFGSAGRQDSKFGLNQKGLQFYDRTHKDILYYYRALMRGDAVMRIAAHEWTRRVGSRSQDAIQDVKVYSNVDEVELLHNGVSLGRVRPENATARFKVAFTHGDNRLHARGVRGGVTVEDDVTVNYEDRRPLFSDESPLARGIAVNAGGHYAVVDEDGTVWEAGRAYEPGAWGHVGGRSVLSHHRIYDTEIDPLWQDTWGGATAYRFDVPDGDYEVRLGFVEVEHDNPRTRVFDVLVNGRVLVQNLDLAASRGRYEKVEYAGRVDVRDGNGVVIELPVKAGESTISTIVLQRR